MKLFGLAAIMLLLAIILLESQTPGIYTYTYDAAGNRITRQFSTTAPPKVVIHPSQTLSDTLVKISPNPTTDYINIGIQNISNYKSVNCKLYDNNGNLVDEVYNINSTLTRLNLDNKSNGVYYIVVNIDGNEIKYKFIKKG